MGGIREEFYSALRREFVEDDFTRSFLYRYLAQEKRGASGLYAQLNGAFTALERGRVSQEDCLREVLRVLVKTPKLRLGQGVRDILWDYGRRIRGGRAFAGARQDRQRYEALLQMLEEAPAEQLAPREWKALREELLKRALEIEAKAFLYDAGFPASDQGRTIPPRKKDRLLDMLDAYCGERRLSLQGTASRAGTPAEDQEDEAWKQRFDEFYRELKRSGNTGVLLPVRVDPRAGVGLYIIGKKYYRGAPAVYRSIRGSCCYAFFYLEDLPPEEDGPALIYRADGEAQDYPNLDEALCWYAEKCRENEFRFFREANGAAPKSCPEAFRDFFEDGWDREGPLSVSQEELEQEAASFGEPPKRRKRPLPRRA